MEDNFFADNMIIYIKIITENFSSNLIIDEFKNMNEQMTIIQICAFSSVVTVILNYVLIFIILGTS